MTATDLSISQRGTFNATSGVWTDGAFSNLGLGLVEAWMQLDHSAILTQVGGPLPTAFTINYLPGFGIPFEDGTFTFYALGRPVTTSFTTAHPPRPLATTLGTLEASITSGISGSISFPLHTSTGQANRLRASLTARSSLTAVGVTWSGPGGGIVLSSPVATHQQAFTGLSGHERAQGRADSCPVCGGYSTRDTWVRSGYLQQMVCPRCYDEDDLVGRHLKVGSERPPVGEG